MQNRPFRTKRPTSQQLNPVEIWQKLLVHLLERHYSLALCDTPLGNDSVIREHIENRVSLCEAINTMVVKQRLKRTDDITFPLMPQLDDTDVLCARRALGLVKANGYESEKVLSIIFGHLPKPKP